MRHRLDVNFSSGILGVFVGVNAKIIQSWTHFKQIVGQSTSSCGGTGAYLDITQETFCLRQEEDIVLNHLIQ